MFKKRDSIDIVLCFLTDNMYFYNYFDRFSECVRAYFKIIYQIC